MKNKTIIVNPVLLMLDVSILIGFLLGFILALNISLYLLVQYYIFGFGMSVIAWIFLGMHFEKIQELHEYFQFIYTGLGIGIVISGFTVIFSGVI